MSSQADTQEVKPMKNKLELQALAAGCTIALAVFGIIMVVLMTAGMLCR